MTDSETLTRTMIDVSALSVHRFESISEPGVIHGVTTRTPLLPLNGNMSFMIGDDQAAVQFNRLAWAEAIGYDPARLVLGRQVHDTSIAVVDESYAGSGADSVETSLRSVDGLITSTPGLPIGVMAADCVPILIYDPVVGAIAAIHAGWRGTVDGIASKAIHRLRATFGSRPNDLAVCLGPSICRDCYQVGSEVIERWNANPSTTDDAVAQTGDDYYFDLRRANQVQLVSSGVSGASIEVSDCCTRCADGATFSRRGLGPRTGLFTAVIMLTGNELSGKELVQ